MRCELSQFATRSQTRHNRTTPPLRAHTPAQRRCRVVAAAAGSGCLPRPSAPPRWSAPPSPSRAMRRPACWHINTGNGYYGGLQFSASRWDAYHGHKYAAQANKATRAEQIEVARRVLAAQGPDAWPVCGPRAGLTRHSGAATHAALPRVAGPSRHARPAAKAARHHAGKVGHHHAHKSRRQHRRTYPVHSGDTLSAIAGRLHVHGGWRALYRANHEHLHNPNVLRIGQHLIVP